MKRFALIAMRTAAALAFAILLPAGCGGVKSEHQLPANVTYQKAAESQESNPLDASTKAQLKRAPAAVKDQWAKEREAAKEGHQ